MGKQENSLTMQLPSFPAFRRKYAENLPARFQPLAYQESGSRLPICSADIAA
jgi:hypothetical protein